MITSIEGNTFLFSLVKVNSNDKKELYNFRRSWKTLITEKRLLDLDIALNKIDGNWPVSESINKNNLEISNTKFRLIFAEACKKVSKFALKNCLLKLYIFF